MESIVPVIDGCVRVCVLEVKWIDDECTGQLEPVANPEAGTIEVCQQEFVRVGVEGIRVLDASHQVLQFRANERVACVSCVHV